MRLLLVSPFLPHDRAAHGGAVYLHAWIEALARHAEVGLVSFAALSELRAGARPPAGVHRSWIIARPDRSDLTGPARPTHLARMLGAWIGSGLPITIAKFRSATMRAVLPRAVAGFRPDVALVEMDLLAQYIPQLGAVPCVLTDHEAGDPVPAAIGSGQLGRRRDARLWDRYVRRSYARASRLQALNPDDAARLAARLERPVAVRPPLVRIPARAVTPATAPPRLLFLGDFTHFPNPEAADFVATHILPRVRAICPEAELWIAGPRPTAVVAALRDRPGVQVLGFVEDLHALLGSVRALVAPVFSGGGTRIKVLTSLAHGLPVVANALALRGIDAPPSAARRGETAGQLADAAIAWVTDASAAGAAGRAARSWAERAIAPDAVARAQLATLESWLAERRSSDADG